MAQSSGHDDIGNNGHLETQSPTLTYHLISTDHHELAKQDVRDRIQTQVTRVCSCHHWEKTQLTPPPHPTPTPGVRQQQSIAIPECQTISQEPFIGSFKHPCKGLRVEQRCLTQEPAEELVIYMTVLQGQAIFDLRSFRAAVNLGE